MYLIPSFLFLLKIDTDKRDIGILIIVCFFIFYLNRHLGLFSLSFQAYTKVFGGSISGRSRADFFYFGRLYKLIIKMHPAHTNVFRTVAQWTEIVPQPFSLSSQTKETSHKYLVEPWNNLYVVVKCSSSQ